MELGAVRTRRRSLWLSATGCSEGERVRSAGRRDAKADQIATTISGSGSKFTLGRMEPAYPGVRRDIVRRVFRDQHAAGLVAARDEGRQRGGGGRGNKVQVRVAMGVIADPPLRPSASRLDGSAASHRCPTLAGVARNCSAADPVMP